MVADKVCHDDAEFKKSFGGKQMIEYMKCSGYYCQKIYDSIINYNPKLGLIHTKMLLGQAKKITTDVEKRFGPVDGCEPIKHDLDGWVYGIKRLENHFNTPLLGRDAEVFHCYVDHKRKEIEEQLCEMDKNFTVDAEGNPLV